MSLFRSAFTVSGLTLGSRILGYIRDVLIAAFIGTGPIADAFFVAFRLPNFFRQISAEGAFNAAFIPLLSGKLAEEGKGRAFQFARKALALMLCILFVLVIVIEMFMPQVMLLLAPGFHDNPAQFDLVVIFGRIMFPYLLFVSMVALFGGVLNSLGKFAVAAGVPMVLSASMITALTLFSSYTHTPAHALALGVLAAGVVQVCVMVWAVRRAGLTLSIKIPRLDKDLKLLLRRMGPGIIGGGVMQINVWVNTIIATLLPSAVSYLYYADRLVQFPLALIGTAMGTALLPTLSKELKRVKPDQAINTQNRALEMVLFFGLPAAMGLALLAEPIIALLFERGEFTHDATLATAAALAAYAFGLPAFIMVKLFTPSFFAAGDTKTPVKIAIVCLVVNVGLNLILMQFFAHVGLAISTAISSWLNVSLLAMVLYKRGKYTMDDVIKRRLPRLIISAIGMGAALYGMDNILAGTLNTEILQRLMSVSVNIGTGAVVYFALAHMLGGFKWQDMKAAFSKKALEEKER